MEGEQAGAQERWLWGATEGLGGPCSLVSGDAGRPLLQPRGTSMSQGQAGVNGDGMGAPAGGSWVGSARGSWHHQCCPAGGTEGSGVPQDRFPFPRPGTGPVHPLPSSIALQPVTTPAAVPLGPLDTPRTLTGPWDTPFRKPQEIPNPLNVLPEHLLSLPQPLEH